MSYNPVNPNGQTTKANSAPVTIASDQNIALETGGNLASIVTNTNSLNNTVGTLSAGTAATKSLAVGGVYNSSAPTPTTGQQLSLQLDGSGNLKISGTVTANLGTIDGAALATNQTDGSQKTKIVDGSGNVIGATSNALDVNIKSGGSSGTQYTNNAVQATPTGTVALGYDGTNVRGLLTDGTGKLQTNITNTSLAVTGTFYQATQPVSGTITANLGTIDGAATAAKQPALGTAGTPSSDVLTVQGASSMTALKVDGSATTQPVSGTIADSNSAPIVGGSTQYSLVSAASTNATNIKATAGVVYSIQVFNNGSSLGYLKLYDKATTPAPATDNAVLKSTIIIPHGSGAGAGVVVSLPVPKKFTSGIGFAITGAIATTDATSVAASQFVVNIDYI